MMIPNRVRPRTVHLRTARRTATIVLAALAASHDASAQPKKAAKNPLLPLDAYVTKAMKDWKVPGVAIAVVKDDSVVLAKGYGVRSLTDATPVDANTIFAIGSSSKAFTAALVAMAVDEGKMHWNDPVTTYLPGFQLYDGYAGRDLTVRDALSHRSGLARGDLTWYAMGYPRDEILRRVRYLKPSWGFRAQFGYQNIMLLAAGQSVAHALGASWDDLVRTRIFTPLGMSSSNTSITALPPNGNVATPHAEIDDTVRAIKWKNIDNIGPAGSINSSANDMTRWLRLQLNHGKFGGKQLVSVGNLDEMWQPNTPIRLEGISKALNAGSSLEAYGMGWFLQDFNGHLAVQHGGNIDGFSAMVAMLPDEKLGVVILTNMDGTLLRDVLWAYVFDLYTRDTPRDWSAEYAKVRAGFVKQGKTAAANLEKMRVPNTTPSLALDRYAGVYSDSMYGDVTITQAAGGLRLEMGNLSGRLEHWNYDTFRAVLDNKRLGKPLARFVLDNEGKPSELHFQPVEEATFRRASTKADTTAAVALSTEQMQHYAGRFTAIDLPLTIDIQMVSGQLKLSVPGQPTYTLVPQTTTRWRLTGGQAPDGFFVDYELEGATVKSVTLVQPAPQPTLKLVPAKQ